MLHCAVLCVFSMSTRLTRSCCWLLLADFQNFLYYIFQVKGKKKLCSSMGHFYLMNITFFFYYWDCNIIILLILPFPPSKPFHIPLLALSVKCMASFSTHCYYMNRLPPPTPKSNPFSLYNASYTYAFRADHLALHHQLGCSSLRMTISPTLTVSLLCVVPRVG